MEKSLPSSPQLQTSRLFVGSECGRQKGKVSLEFCYCEVNLILTNTVSLTFLEDHPGFIVILKRKVAFIFL